MRAGLLVLLMLGQEGIRLRNQSGAPKAVREINCVGVGVQCSATSTFGTLFVDAGAGLRAAGPLYMDGGSVVCGIASATAGGCLSIVGQEIAGYKTLKNGGQADDIFQCTAQFPRNLENDTVYVSQINYYGVMVGNGPIAPTFDEGGLVLRGRRTSTSVAPEVQITPSTFRDAGSFFQVLDYPGAGGQVFGIAASGDVTFSSSPRYAALHNTEPAWIGNLQDLSGLSGHIALKSSPKLYLAIGSLLQDNHDSIEADGGCPVYDGGTWVVLDGGTGVGADGGVCATYYSYAGNHGDVTIIPHGPHVGGWLLEVKNPVTGTSTDTKFALDSNGGMVHPSPMHRVNFPPRAVGFLTSIGQFSYGVAPSTMYYANGTNEQRWFWYDDEKADYQQFAHQAPVFLPGILLNTTVSVATIGGTVIPASNHPLFDAIHLYVGSAGSGGSTNVNFRADDGAGNQCNFAVACNTGTGPKRLAGTGNCTAIAAGSTVTWSITSVGDCGVPMTVTGSVTPEVRWR